MDKQNMLSQDTLQSFISDGTSQAVRDRYASLPEIAATMDFGDLDHNVVVLDTETTGFSFNHDELTQIAAARMEQGEIVEWFITFVNPGKPIPEDVAHLTDIHDSDVADAPLPADALAKLVEFIGDAKVVAHNAEFDRTFTTRHPSGYPLLENTWIDSLDLARIALPRMKSHRLLDLVRAFGAPLSTHRADATSRQPAPSSASCLQVSPRCRRRLCARSPIWRLLTSGRRGWYSSSSPESTRWKRTKMFT